MKVVDNVDEILKMYITSLEHVDKSVDSVNRLWIAVDISSQ